MNNLIGDITNNENCKLALPVKLISVISETVWALKMWKSANLNRKKDNPYLSRSRDPARNGL